MTVAHRCLVVIICGLSALPGPLHADDTPASTTNTPIARDVQENANRSDLPDKRQRTFTVGVLILLGITITGLGLLVVVILWGHRVRRRSRDPLPEASRGDDLFYLKTGNKPQQDTTVIPPKPPHIEE